MITIPTYPLRPVNGGPLPGAPRKRGRWIYEPKVNGWRALVHTPTGSMFNRQGERLSIEAAFRPVLRELEHCSVEWLDCEAFDRRHALGRGSLVVLDFVPTDAVLSVLNYEGRQALLHAELQGLPCFHSWAYAQFEPEGKLLSFAYTFREEDPDMPPLEAWSHLQKCNAALGAEVFEGLVAKRADSLYPLQKRSPGEEFRGWIKHRWRF